MVIPWPDKEVFRFAAPQASRGVGNDDAAFAVGQLAAPFDGAFCGRIEQRVQGGLASSIAMALVVGKCVLSLITKAP